MRIELTPQELAEMLQKPPRDTDLVPFGWVVKADEETTGTDGVFCRTAGARDMLLGRTYREAPTVIQVFAKCS